MQFVLSFSFINSFKPAKMGDGRPVLLVPGFFNNSSITWLMRKFLTRIGYKTYDWGLGFNTGDIKDLQPLSERFQEIYRETGQKVTLIGFSLGGVYAREVAKKHPEMTAGLFTMGSPFRGLDKPNNASFLFKLLNPKGDETKELKDFMEAAKTPAPVPTVAMYSKTDGVVPWEACMESPEDDLHENVEIKSSHFGFVMNKEVFRTIANRIPEQPIGFKKEGTAMWV